MVSLSMILMFAFRHLVISGVSFYSCLLLESVHLVILLTSISRSGRLALSSVFQWSEHSLQASSPLAGKMHRYLAFGPAFGGPKIAWKSSRDLGGWRCLPTLHPRHFPNTASGPACDCNGTEDVFHSPVVLI